MSLEALDEMIASARRLGLLPEAAARLAVPYVDAAVKATAAAGTTPDGEPWTPKKDGGRPLANAAAALSTKALGSTVVVTLEGPEVIHNFGDKHNPKRQILPDGGAGIPKNVAAALTRAAGEAFELATEGR